jgi:hypothetical protein
VGLRLARLVSSRSPWAEASVFLLAENPQAALTHHALRPPLPALLHILQHPLPSFLPQPPVQQLPDPSTHFLAYLIDFGAKRHPLFIHNIQLFLGYKLRIGSFQAIEVVLWNFLQGQLVFKSLAGAKERPFPFLSSVSSSVDRHPCVRLPQPA